MNDPMARDPTEGYRGADEDGQAALRLLEQAITIIDAAVDDELLGAKLSECIDLLKRRLSNSNNA